jgi:hypothetical protein
MATFILNRIKAVNQHMHVERRCGTQREAVDYCQKDNDFTENGAGREQRKRDLIEIKKL